MKALRQSGTITSDLLHCQKANARAIVEKGGNFLFQIKGNQPGLYAQAQAFDALPHIPFLPKPLPVTGA